LSMNARASAGFLAHNLPGRSDDLDGLVGRSLALARRVAIRVVASARFFAGLSIAQPCLPWFQQVPL